MVPDKHPGEWEAMLSYLEEPEAAAANGCQSASAIARNMTYRRYFRS
jgi:hypothetical protein